MADQVTRAPHRDAAPSRYAAQRCTAKPYGSTLTPLLPPPGRAPQAQSFDEIIKSQKSVKGIKIEIDAALGRRVYAAEADEPRWYGIIDLWQNPVSERALM
eukprot:1767260-Prymnesium_polylepis.1